MVEAANEPSLADVVDAAIAEVSPETPDAEEIEAEASEPEAEEPEADEPEGEESAEEEPEGDEPAEEEPEGEEPVDGETPEQKATREKAAKAAKEPDVVNDPIPEGMNEKTRKRMTSLIDKVKGLTADYEKSRQDNDFLVGAVRDTGANPQQFGETLGFLKLMNSGDKEQQRTALGLAKQVVLNLAAIIGEPVGELDVLSGHQDLLTRVQGGKLTRADAEELALARNQTKLRTGAETAVRTEQQGRQQREQEVAAGRKAINDLETELRKSDPRYEEKRAKMIADTATMAAINKLPPSQWPGAFSQAFLKVRLAPKAPVTKVPPNQPLRAKTRAGGAAQTGPKSMLDAINGALSEMGK